MNRYIYFVFAIAVTITVLGCKENEPPKIISLQLLAEDIHPGDSVVLLTSAVDPEKGRLRFQWRTNGGMLSDGNDSTIIWYAPERPGRYKIWVRVNDALGARARKSIKLKVVQPYDVSSDSLGDSKGYKPPKGFRVKPPPRRPGGRQTGSTNKVR
jgi:hypothetical protein